jgi:hypothetical protein
MSKPIIITIITAEKKLGEKLTDTIGTDQLYKYMHSKLLLARMRIVKHDVADFPEEDQAAILRNVLTVERNIAAMAAEQYAELNQQEIFINLTEIVQEIDELLNA